MAAVLGIGLMAAAGVSLAVLPRGAPSSAPEPAARIELLTARSEQVAVIDSGTLRLGDRIVRLRGVEPPSHTTACAGQDCGAAAANALAAMVRDAPVVCQLGGADGLGRPYAVCHAGGTELNRAVVAAGWARASADAPDLARAEYTARADNRGVWAQNPDW
ncbi:MAG TPA: thermonuclease family protein [Acetobacteraceae bacterium]|jgi:endonuclease YncB( thermonuclease family)